MTSWLNAAKAKAIEVKQAAEKAAKEAHAAARELQKKADVLAQNFPSLAAPAGHRVLDFVEGPLGFALDGACVVAVDPDGQAAKHGVQPGDQVVAVAFDPIPPAPPDKSAEEGKLLLKKQIGRRIKEKGRPVQITFAAATALLPPADAGGEDVAPTTASAAQAGNVEAHGNIDHADPVEAATGGESAPCVVAAEELSERTTCGAVGALAPVPVMSQSVEAAFPAQVHGSASPHADEESRPFRAAGSVLHTELQEINGGDETLVQEEELIQVAADNQEPSDEVGGVSKDVGADVWGLETEEGGAASQVCGAAWGAAEEDSIDEGFGASGGFAGTGWGAAEEQYGAGQGGAPGEVAAAAQGIEEAIIEAKQVVVDSAVEDGGCTEEYCVRQEQPADVAADAQVVHEDQGPGAGLETALVAPDVEEHGREGGGVQAKVAPAALSPEVEVEAVLAAPSHAVTQSFEEEVQYGDGGEVAAMAPDIQEEQGVAEGWARGELATAPQSADEKGAQVHLPEERDRYGDQVPAVRGPEVQQRDDGEVAAMTPDIQEEQGTAEGWALGELAMAALSAEEKAAQVHPLEGGDQYGEEVAAVRGPEVEGRAAEAGAASSQEATVAARSGEQAALAATDAEELHASGSAAGAAWDRNEQVALGHAEPPESAPSVAAVPQALPPPPPPHEEPRSPLRSALGAEQPSCIVEEVPKVDKDECIHAVPADVAVEEFREAMERRLEEAEQHTKRVTLEARLQAEALVTKHAQEVAHMQAALLNLEQTLEQKERKLRDLEVEAGERETLCGWLRECEDKLKESEKQGNAREKQLQQLQQEHMLLAAKHEAEKRKVEELTMKSDALRNNLHGVTGELSYVRNQLQEQDAAHVKEVGSLQEGALDARNYAQAIQVAANEKYDALRSELLDAVAQQEVLRGALTASGAEAASANAESCMARANHQDALRHASELKANVLHIHAELLATKERDRRHQTELEGMRTECRELHGAAEQRDVRVSAAQVFLETRVQTLHDQLLVVRGEHECAMAQAQKYEDQTVEIKTHCDELQREVVESNNRCNSLSEASQRDALVHLQEVARLREVIADAERQHAEDSADVISRATTAEAMVARFREAATLQAQEADSATAKLAAADGQIAVLQQELATLRDGVLHGLQEEVTSTRAVAESHKHLVHALRQRLAEQELKAEARIEELQHRVNDLHRAPSEGRVDMSYLRNVSIELEEPGSVGNLEASLIGCVESTEVTPALATDDGGRRCQSAPSPPEAAGLEEMDALYQRIAYLEKRCNNLQNKVKSRPIIFQAAREMHGSDPLGLEMGTDRRPTWERWVACVGSPVARCFALPPGWERCVGDAVEGLRRKLEHRLEDCAQRLLKNKCMLRMFIFHLLVLYTIAALCLSTGSAPAECLEGRMQRLASHTAVEAGHGP